MLDDFKVENIKGCKYTMRLGELFKHDDIALVDAEHDDHPDLIELSLPYVLQPDEYVIGRTIESFDMPLDLMSTYAASSLSIRLGLNILLGGINDPGYEGNAVMGIKNESTNRIKLYEEMELLHTAFHDMKGDAIPVQTKYLGGKIL